MKQIKSKKIELITWLFFLISSFSLFFLVTHYAIFPSKYKMPLLLGILFSVSVTGIITIISKKGFRYFAIVLNLLLIAFMVIGLVFLPNIERRVRNIFKEVQTDESIINVYALNKDSNKDKLEAYSNPTFITQKRNDQSNQSYALDQIKELLGEPSLKIIQKDDIIAAVDALYEEEGKLLILNENYVGTVEEIEKFANFSLDTKVVASFSNEIEVEIEEPIPKEITEAMFTIYAAGEDTRSGRLSIYGRTDVDIIANINPVTKQIMLISLPRDTYIPNPAIGYGLDKLTHLGNHGIQNTMKGVSEYYKIDIDYYGVVNFNTFKNIINALDGIDIYNPYYFSTYFGNGGMYDINYEFPEGNLHLYGDEALAYCRERYNLPNGDYGRNEHQIIIFKSIIEKLMSPDVITYYDEVIDTLQQQFLTNMAVDDIYKLIAMQLDDNSDWDIITYHMGGIGDMQGTASMGWDRMLYVVHPFESQVKFIQTETEKMKNNEIISQQSLPNEGDSTYILN